ncbi:MAG: aldehyde dehydrogenase family protein [Ignavibacteria bacterium]|nr:aldehyde dehydrogenase family protein [Ignavibacteria bacterium]
MSRRLEIPKMYKLFIGGKFTRTESERYIQIRSYKENTHICNVSRASKKDLRNAVKSARETLTLWSSKTAYERAQILYRLAEMLEGRKKQFAEEISLLTGLIENKALSEVTRSIDRIIYYAGFADKWVHLAGTVNPVQNGYFNFSIPEPTGVVGIILPDEPSLLAGVTRICPVIASGNTCVVLTSEKYPLPMLSFSEVISTSDVPGGTVNILTGLKSELIPHLAGHMDINSIDYSDNNLSYKKNIQELCAINVKRFILSSSDDWNDDQKHENLKNITDFTEVKTVWHTMGM